MESCNLSSANTLSGHRWYGHGATSDTTSIREQRRLTHTANQALQTSCCSRCLSNSLLYAHASLAALASKEQAQCADCVVAISLRRGSTRGGVISKHSDQRIWAACHRGAGVAPSGADGNELGITKCCQNNALPGLQKQLPLQLCVPGWNEGATFFWFVVHKFSQLSVRTVTSERSFILAGSHQVDPIRKEAVGPLELLLNSFPTPV